MHALVDRDQLGFDQIPADYMFMMTCLDSETFSGGSFRPYQKLELHPASAIQNYGHPEENAHRIKMGADRMCMTSSTPEQLVHDVKQTILANKHWKRGLNFTAGSSTREGVPHSLYIRPLFMGTGTVLALGPTPEFSVLVYAAPVGNVHKARISLDLLIQERFHQATPGWTGGIKSIINYSQVFKPIKEPKAEGFSNVLFLDAVTVKYVEEACSCNIFIVKGKTIPTPTTKDTILPGITRKSMIEIALTYSYQKLEETYRVYRCNIPQFYNFEQVAVRLVLVKDLTLADGVFCTGTAVGVVPVSRITYQGKG
ncbi:hypothetical protein SAY87_024760 [Trapa incisa]|uniref:Branched-chain-amino-acid aminotransferase n=1 Tax=Trapa incisa TaxID=236973 RepID=A0AAN7JFN0_9MYRT|nr:hypothetical protein SAY87_024760 [Trapa incisa]